MSDLFLAPTEDQHTPELPRRRRERATKKAHERKKRRRRSVVVVVMALLLVAGAGYVVWSVVGDAFSAGGSNEQASDFPGPGHGTAQVVINPGDTGSAMAQTLVEAGVVATPRAFTAAFTANPESASIQPGTYNLYLEMRARDAVDALLDPSNRVSLKVTVPEGYTAEQIYERIASVVTDVTVEDLQAAAADPAVGLPAQAGGSIEGWLYPATYQFEPGTTAPQMLQAMVAKTTEVLAAKGVPADQWEDVLIRASLAEREARTPEDRAMVAQAIQNRLDREMRLEIDAALAYGLGKPGTALTNADKESDSPFNLYRVLGLPPTPIASPGDVSIDAVLSPTPGDWVFWVTVNLETGETLFADNFDDHQANVQKLREWEAANGG